MIRPITMASTIEMTSFPIPYPDQLAREQEKSARLQTLLRALAQSQISRYNVIVSWWPFLIGSAFFIHRKNDDHNH